MWLLSLPEPKLSSARAFLLHGWPMLTARSRGKEAPRERRDATMPARDSEIWLLSAGWFFVALGSALRIVQYVENHSLSIDESYLALNLIEKSPWELLRALD